MEFNHENDNLVKSLQESFALLATIHKVYIDGPCGSKTFAGVLLARFERVSHMTRLKKIGQIGPVHMQYVGLWNFPSQMFAERLSPGISLLQKMFD